MGDFLDVVRVTAVVTVIFSVLLILFGVLKKNGLILQEATSKGQLMTFFITTMYFACIVMGHDFHIAIHISVAALAITTIGGRQTTEMIKAFLDRKTGANKK